MSAPELKVTQAECLHLSSAVGLHSPSHADTTCKGLGSGADLQKSLLQVPSSDNDEEVITETQIIGVTETGVIRKRSFKRKLTKEEKMLRKFGDDKAEYEKIYSRVMADRFVINAVDLLRERLKMLTMMYEDCQNMMVQRERQCQESLRAIQTKRARESIVAMALVLLLIVCILFVMRAVFW